MGFGEEIINKLFLATDNNGKTVLHLAAEDDKTWTLQKKLDWAKEKLKKEEVSKLLLDTGNKGITAWQVAALWCQPEILKRIRDLAVEKLTIEEINKKNRYLPQTTWEGPLFI